jgi:hypothetical protein
MRTAAVGARGWVVEQSGKEKMLDYGEAASY